MFYLINNYFYFIKYKYTLKSKQEYNNKKNKNIFLNELIHILFTLVNTNSEDLILIIIKLFH